MKKSVKATVATLPIGQVMPDELAAILKLAADGADYLWIGFYWKDGHDAHTHEEEDITPIEDAGNIARVTGDFHYGDGSSLDLTLNEHGPELTAKGATARDRLTTITEYWARLPQRSRLSWKQHHLTLLPVLTGLTVGLLVWLFMRAATSGPLSGIGWLIYGTVLATVLSCHVAARLSVPARTERKLVTLTRRPGPSAGTIAGAVTALGTVAAPVIALLALFKT